MFFGKGLNPFQNARKAPPQEEDWLITYADAITLILAFFVLLASISKIDMVMFEKVQAGMAKDIGRRDVLQPIEILRIDIIDTVRALKAEDLVEIGNDSQGLTLEIPSSTFFDSGSADLRAEAVPVLRQIAATISDPKFSGFQIEVQGHSDDMHINTPRFPSNWELSSARASAAVRAFLEVGLDPTRIKAIGFAETSPKVPNRDMNGNPLPANQEINRRILVRVYPR
ncbi:OmpA family protein [Telmatospirillum sp. J64-1]|uniref:OmpA/MotB family protein n=1 Tax=Telmatospirillum sp. J64-1 TaxID=2502183 RepID=UPI00115D4FED|nr:OmpA family protein [Telmatospirillum sp. J64-1]